MVVGVQGHNTTRERPGWQPRLVGSTPLKVRWWWCWRWWWRWRWWW
ncbi:hypothetical protein E2C01_078764 [Portunus trituberculatus]|uniref:Uncharacterized protein n=1 Tax=Portunus trituberculatus TaxID=210409 RepID=A0A5B7IPK8_PORTR|nr:hypothetical protein [Portunus trituberculatus]